MTSRFATISTNELEEHLNSVTPENTIKKMRWATKLFREWHEVWKVRLDGELKVLKSLNDMCAEDYNYCFQYFFAETRKKNGQRYPPGSLKDLACMLQLYFQKELKNTWNIWKDDVFKKCRLVLDAEMRISARNGNVNPRKRPDCIAKSTEEQMWQANILGSETPTKLLHTLLFSIGIHCGLRGRLEQYNLTVSNFTIVEENNTKILVFTEGVSKCRNYGIRQARLEPKVIRILASEPKEKCLVNLFQLYMAKRPPNAINEFYLSPILNPSTHIWYKNSRMGINQVAKVVQILTSSLDDGKKYSNNSLRRSTKTRLVENNIPNEVSRRIVGHMSSSESCYIAQTALESETFSAIKGTKQSLFNLLLFERFCKFWL